MMQPTTEGKGEGVPSFTFGQMLYEGDIPDKPP